MTRAPQLPPQVPSAFTRVPVASSQGASRRDQGTSPVQFPSYDQPEMRHVRFQTVRVDVVNSQGGQSSVPQAGEEQDQERRRSDLRHPAAQQSSSTLDQLWERFCLQWRLEESRPTSDREASLLERLERLSRLIHSTRGSDMSEGQGETFGRRGGDAAGRERKKVNREEKSVSWTQRLPETSQPEDSVTSSVSHDSSQSPHLCPADRDESETLSTTSGSVSTVDTARLIRAFGAHRVQHVKTSSGLSKLYGAIDRQKEGREQKRGRNKEPPHTSTPSETTGTDESTVSVSARVITDRISVQSVIKYVLKIILFTSNITPTFISTTFSKLSKHQHNFYQKFLNDDISQKIWSYCF